MRTQIAVFNFIIVHGNNGRILSQRLVCLPDIKCIHSLQLFHEIQLLFLHLTGYSTINTPVDDSSYCTAVDSIVCAWLRLPSLLREALCAETEAWTQTVSPSLTWSAGALDWLQSTKHCSAWSNTWTILDTIYVLIPTRKQIMRVWDHPRSVHLLNTVEILAQPPSNICYGTAVKESSVHKSNFSTWLVRLKAVVV